MTDVLDDVTEFVKLNADELHVVGSGANGFSPLLAKGKKDCDTCGGDGVVKPQSACPDCHGRGTSHDGTKCPECNGDGIVKQQKICPTCTGTGLKKSPISTKSKNDLPDSAFAYIEGGGTKDESGKTTPRSLRHFPVHDEAHARNALARASSSPFGAKAMPKIKRAAKRFGIKVGKVALDPPEVRLQKAAGRLGIAGEETGRGLLLEVLKGLREQSDAFVATMTLAKNGSAAFALNTTDADGEAPPTGDSSPGSPSWEADDAEMLIDAGQGLSGVIQELEAMINREQTEVDAGETDDVGDVMNLEDAMSNLEDALDAIASGAFHEEAESGMVGKEGRVLSGATVSQLRMAIDGLQELLARGGNNSGATSAPDDEVADILGNLTKEDVQDIATALAEATALAKQASKIKAEPTLEERLAKAEKRNAKLMKAMKQQKKMKAPAMPDAGAGETPGVEATAAKAAPVQGLGKKELRKLSRSVTETVAKQFGREPRKGGPLATDPGPRTGSEVPEIAAMQAKVLKAQDSGNDIEFHRASAALQREILRKVFASRGADDRPSKFTAGNTFTENSSSPVSGGVLARQF